MLAQAVMAVMEVGRRMGVMVAAAVELVDILAMEAQAKEILAQAIP